ncbi:hypothetical protein [Rivihabitans pingtungensis]|jgi:hypothetical protein|uniref:hypothetical protein n=1 Tax=Rivihabitans pingtungensis TaxID=1054498 RepID=UPI001304C536
MKWGLSLSVRRQQMHRPHGKIKKVEVAPRTKLGVAGKACGKAAQARQEGLVSRA